MAIFDHQYGQYPISRQRTGIMLTRELIPVRNPAGSARNPAGIRPDSDRIRSVSGRNPTGIKEKMKKYFILLNKDLFKQKCDYIVYC
jgi:hypothetical protein